MNATVYIQKRNRSAWESLDNKSAWVNDHLEDLRGQTPPQAEQTWEDMILGQIEDYGLHPSDKPGYAVNDNGEYVRYTIFNDKVTIVK